MSNTNSRTSEVPIAPTQSAPTATSVQTIALIRRTRMRTSRTRPASTNA